ncbi:sulfite exporter TauE/SafE family protein [Actinotalea sp. K2]|uniref:sulfite exporter TauE/SafE family protein n=1 Tax=Actinotalea sp. K2 TaxID=2939438 RepID=UPI002017E503|nr:sulfite exporter TauE/SafE family protein [Actinotalea sp. K2]MCL3861924.1 sulfite exporter TauE/SafE family protein [Actinotalea sp. K2]
MTPADPTAAAHHRPPWLTLALIGVLGGALSGAFGVGGGILMVPLLITLGGMDQRRAAATSLVAIVPASIAGSATYLANGRGDLLVALVVAVGGVTGSYLGARLLRRIPLTWLRWMFVTLLVVVAARMLLVAPARGDEVELGWLVGVGLVAAGLFMGVASGLFGIGGGVVLVPILIAVFGAGDLVAKGTSLLVMVPTAMMGTVTNVRGRLVDLRVGATVGLAATVASFGGVALAFVIPTRISGVLFALLLIFSAVQLSIRALRSNR